ncbi:nucleoside-diphosphate-sugar epimerase [Steroidobacter agaridevorans]|uniref:Nucleoside-diphosphate-sugar epimerase n=1 Tax=Steroidobacter agaridevorans TaxID=2695856 RepID=A0A829YLZ8_9GAMM|nr:NAD-dependent epimerase/dehydratase family protein [Steroidobacter agaridevorans]GFE83911.1 nucleoside-diphosphate-sugar epimerase [Steroidobacter agaridevorans]
MGKLWTSDETIQFSGRGGNGRWSGDALVLVTGGAGFIGSHVANLLAESGSRVRVIDALDAQVHGEEPGFPAHLHADVERVEGDIRDRETLSAALQGVTHVCHLAAAVGVGQSMYEIERYVDINNRGTALLLETLMDRPLQRLVVASSMSVYGEGLYRQPGGNGSQYCEPQLRSREQLSEGRWEIETAEGELEPVATPETKHVAPASVYALSKYDQEQMCHMFGSAYGVPTVALRFFNAYGPHQALSNPYTGVLAIFASRCLNGNSPLIFEDGRQRRDFVSVRDVAHACRLALTTPAIGETFNIGSGEPRTVLEVANSVIDAVNAPVDPLVTGKYRIGDIRHCFADISKAERLLGYRPQVKFEDGLVELAEWLAGTSANDNFMRASAELDRRGLTL